MSKNIQMPLGVYSHKAWSDVHAVFNDMACLMSPNDCSLKAARDLVDAVNVNRALNGETVIAVDIGAFDSRLHGSWDKAHPNGLTIRACRELIEQAFIYCYRSIIFSSRSEDADYAYVTPLSVLAYDDDDAEEGRELTVAELRFVYQITCHPGAGIASYFRKDIIDEMTSTPFDPVKAQLIASLRDEIHRLNEAFSNEMEELRMKYQSKIDSLKRLWKCENARLENDNRKNVSKIEQQLHELMK